jgi:hypothetical protein
MIQYSPGEEAQEDKSLPDFLRNVVFVEKAHVPLLLACAVLELAKKSNDESQSKPERNEDKTLSNLPTTV